jgi:oligosaccharide repeat unit polymerase
MEGQIEAQSTQMLPDSKYMKLCIGELVLFILTFVLFFIRPENVSVPFTYLCFGLFLTSSVLYFKYKGKENYLDFDTLFVLLYGILGFAYPVFLYDEENPFSIAFQLSFDTDYIPLGVVCFVLGIQAYYIGGMLTKNARFDKQSNHSDVVPINNSVLSIIVVLLCLVFILSGGVQYYQSYYKYNNAADSGIVLQILALMHAFAVTSIAIEFYNKCIDQTYKLNKLLIFSIFIIIALMLYAGNRTLASQLALPVLGLFALYFKNVGKLQILLLIVFGILFMWIIQFNRAGNAITADDAEVENMISDLTIPTRSTYSGMEYVDNFGHTYGLNMLGGIIATIPSGERILTHFGVRHNSLSSAELLTEYTLGEGSTLGLGTNIITDIYVSFGLPGILLLMFFLGFFVNRQLYNASNLKYYSVILYACLMSYSVYLVRSTYTHPMKLIVWCLIIGMLNKSLSQKLFRKAE